MDKKKGIWCELNHLATELHVLSFTPECKGKWNQLDEIIGEIRKLADELVA